MSMKGYLEELKAKKFDEWDKESVNFVINMFRGGKSGSNE